MSTVEPPLGKLERKRRVNMAYWYDSPLRFIPTGVYDGYLKRKRKRKSAWNVYTKKQSLMEPLWQNYLVKKLDDIKRRFNEMGFCRSHKNIKKLRL